MVYAIETQVVEVRVSVSIAPRLLSCFGSGKEQLRKPINRNYSQASPATEPQVVEVFERLWNGPWLHEKDLDGVRVQLIIL